MFKILVLADIHGEFEKLSNVIEDMKKETFDLVICPGDFTDMFNIPEGYSQMDVAEIVLQKILSLGEETLCIPGNHDPHEILELFDEYEVNLHRRVTEFGNYQLMGFGGASTPFNTKFEPTDEEIGENLAKMEGKINRKLILVTHNPPKGTRLDSVEGGKHVGSEAVANFIRKSKPLLAISAHIHENQGTDKIGKSVLFYPGTVFEGKYGIVTIGKKIRCEIKTLG